MGKTKVHLLRYETGNKIKQQRGPLVLSNIISDKRNKSQYYYDQIKYCRSVEGMKYSAEYCAYIT